MRFLVNKVALEQVSLRLLLFFPVSIIPPVFHTISLSSYCCGHNEESIVEISEQVIALLVIGKHDKDKRFRTAL